MKESKCTIIGFWCAKNSDDCIYFMPNELSKCRFCVMDHCESKVAQVNQLTIWLKDLGIKYKSEKERSEQTDFQECCDGVLYGAEDD